MGRRRHGTRQQIQFPSALCAGAHRYLGGAMASSLPLILVVDDEPSMRKYLRTCLELQPYRVETADGGADALTKLSNGPAPDLVLLDVAMPGMDGLETLQQIRSTTPGQKVVML